MSAPAKQVHFLSSCVSYTMLVQVTLKPSLSNTLASIIGGNKAPIICTVNHTEETLSMYQAARMPPQQLAIVWQVHERD